MNASTTAMTRSRLLIALSALATACGGRDEESAASSEPPPSAEQPAAPGGAVTATVAPGEERMANAVVTSKTAAAVDLKYDMSARPDVGRPFEIELVFVPRVAAESLQVEVTGMEGLTVVGGAALGFDNVQAGERYAGKVLVQADAAGLYYVGLVAKMSSKVQTEARSFSVPVVVGTVPAAVQKPAPEVDASGQPVESMPAVESGAAADAARQ
jgi:hypothetical protein